jgi:multiple sugar transport system ATP-binding protein
MRAEIKHLQDELGITTIYVTHDQIEAMTLADRVAVMNKGVIRQLSSPEALYDDPADLFVAGFIGSPPMNLLRGDLDDGAFVAPGIRVPGVARGSRAGVVLGVRPDDVRLTGPHDGIAAAVFACELTGEAVLLTADAGGQRIAARLERRARHATGEAVGLNFDPARTFLFDAATERRIRPGD